MSADTGFLAPASTPGAREPGKRGRRRESHGHGQHLGISVRTLLCRGAGDGKAGRRPRWIGMDPPVLCCGQPLRPLETGQVLSATLPRRRTAHCPRCGFEVGIVVYPVRPLVCAICQAEFAVGEGDAGVAGTGEAQVSGQTPRG